MDQPADRPLPECYCNICHERLLAIAAGDGGGVAPQPEPGVVHIAMCPTCGAIMGVDQEWKPRPLTDQELEELMRDPALLLQLALAKREVDRRNALRARRN